MSLERLESVRSFLDRLNAEDPVQVTVDGKSRARELVFADRLEAWILRLKPEPGQALWIAARGQHVRRWAIARSTYPEGRGGYLRWREDLKKMHAATVAEVMSAEGYSEAEISAVTRIVQKRGIAEDPDVQIMEDALCLVFLETQFDDLREKTPDDKMIEILRKSWSKMSPAGRNAALSLPLTESQKDLVSRALA